MIQLNKQGKSQVNLYTEHYNKVADLKRNFEKILEKLNAVEKFEDKLELALFAAKYFVYNNTGYFTSSVLEKFFVDYANTIKVDISGINYKPNSFLHVLTEGYKTGGHTRVVERWLENAPPPKSQLHSVVLTRANSIKLSLLEKCVKDKNGEYICLNNNLSLKEKALELRKLAMQYEYIILHTHMEDPIAIIAFGSEDFTRPVLLYNHASHMPWIGKSIADLVLDIEHDDEVTRIKRGIQNTYFVGVPSKEIAISVPDKIKIRKELNLPHDKKIIVTSGPEAKYRTICGHNFIDYIKEIIDENTYCYVIGIEPENIEWKKAKADTNNHIIPLGFIDFSKGFLNYLKAADLYLDSYPLCGGTATIDAISCGTPALSLKSVYPQFDYFTRTTAYCKTKDEFINKAKKVLNNNEYAKNLYEELKNSLLEYQSIEAWNKRIENLFSKAPKTHNVKDLSKVTDNSKICDLSVLCNVLINSNFLKKKKIKPISDKKLNMLAKYGKLYKKQGVPYIFQTLFYKKADKEIKLFTLFNIIKLVPRKYS